MMMCFLPLNQRLTDMASESYMAEIGLGNVGYDQYLNLTKWINVATVLKGTLSSKKEIGQALNHF